MAKYRGLQLKVGVKVLSNKLPKASGELEDRLDRIVRKATYDIQGWVQALLEQQGAVDTGTLVNSVTSTFPSKLHGLVATNVEYAGFVEYGTVHMAARPAWFPASEKVRPSLVAAAKAELAGLGG